MLGRLPALVLRRVALVAVFAACLALPWVWPGVTGLFAPEAAAPRVPAARTLPPVQGAVQGAVLGPFVPAGPVAQQGLHLPGRLAAAGVPRRVQVPRLGVDAPILPISGQSGTLLPPSDPQVLGWWQEGRQAGAAAGATVLTGHTVSTGGGALDHLGTLRRGDLVTVVTDAGRITYQVAWGRTYPTAEFAERSGRLLSQDRPGRLVLITCDGWNGSEYLASAVVVARPVAQRTS